MDLKFALKFFLKFFGIFAVAQIVFMGLNTEWLQNYLAQILGQTFQIAQVGNRLQLPNGTLAITEFCLGLFSISLLAACFFSIGKINGRKLKIFVFGSLGLFAINFVRVFALAFSALEFGFEAAGLLHVFSWFLMSFLALGILYFSQ